jgi:phospholipase/lecithinase/hemolysin
MGLLTQNPVLQRRRSRRASLLQLVQLCTAAGLRLVAWDPFHPTLTGHAIDTYTSFVFEK